MNKPTEKSANALSYRITKAVCACGRNDIDFDEAQETVEKLLIEALDEVRNEHEAEVGVLVEADMSHNYAILIQSGSTWIVHLPKETFTYRVLVDAIDKIQEYMEAQEAK